jgi:hypothetical protein
MWQLFCYKMGFQNGKQSYLCKDYSQLYTWRNDGKRYDQYFTGLSIGFWENIHWIRCQSGVVIARVKYNGSSDTILPLHLSL